MSQDIGRKLKQLRKGRGMTQEEDVYEFIKAYVDKIKKTPSAATESLVKSLINAFLESVKINNETVEIQLRLDFFNLRFHGCDNARFAGAIRSLSQLETEVSTPRSSINQYDLKSILSEY